MSDTAHMYPLALTDENQLAQLVMFHWYHHQNPLCNILRSMLILKICAQQKKLEQANKIKFNSFRVTMFIFLLIVIL